MGQQPLSTDPNAGVSSGPLSTDPNAGGPLSTDPNAGQKPQGALDFTWGAGRALYELASTPVTLLKSMYDDTVGHATKALKAYDEGSFGKAALEGYAALPISVGWETGGKIAKGIVKASYNEIKQAKAAYDKGDYAKAAGYTALAIPVVGPAAGEIVEDFRSGDLEKMGHGTVNAALALSPLAAEGAARLPIAAAKYARKLPVPALARSSNPVKAAAADYVMGEGVPVSLAGATSNPTVRYAQEWADNSLGGALSGANAEAQLRADAMKGLGTKLATEAHPGIYTPVAAGESVQGALQARVDQFRQAADAAYGKIRSTQKSSEPVKFEVPGAAPRAVGFGPAGPAPPPVTEAIQFPVDLRDVKKQLAPIEAELSRNMPITQQQANPGLKAIRNILDGPDRGSLTQVDRDLSVIKTLAREHQGLAKAVVPKLHAAVEEAAITAGPDVYQALQEGRKAVTAQYKAQETLDALSSEGIKNEAGATFKALTRADDLSLNRLRAVARETPSELPKIGRAIVQDLLDTATAEGEFAHGRAIANRWNALGDETKKLLYPNPTLRENLDKFFLSASEQAQIANPSGSGHLIALAGQGYLLWHNPIDGVRTVIGGAALSRMMHNPTAVKALTQGFTIPVTKTAQSVAAATAISKALDRAQQDGDGK